MLVQPAIQKQHWILTTTAVRTSLVMDGKTFSAYSTPKFTNILGKDEAAGLNNIRRVILTFCKSVKNNTKTVMAKTVKRRS